jgi:ribonuclease P protein component
VPAQTVGRITSRGAFSELQRSRCRGASGPVQVTFVAAQDGSRGVFPQVGYAIGRRCGGAVTRNTLRRRAREVVRSEAPGLARGSYLVRLGPGASELAPGRFRRAVSTALRRAGAGGTS